MRKDIYSLVWVWLTYIQIIEYRPYWHIIFIFPASQGLRQWLQKDMAASKSQTQEHCANRCKHFVLVLISASQQLLRKRGFSLWFSANH